MDSAQKLIVGGFFPRMMKQYGADLDGLPMEDRAEFCIVGDDGKQWTIRPSLPLVVASRRRTASEREEWIDDRHRRILKSHFSADRLRLCSRIASEIHEAMRLNKNSTTDRERVKALTMIQNRLMLIPNLDMREVRADLRALPLSAGKGRRHPSQVVTAPCEASANGV